MALDPERLFGTATKRENDVPGCFWQCWQLQTGLQKLLGVTAVADCPTNNHRRTLAPRGPTCGTTIAPPARRR
jgi:hypothetical protein